MKFKILLIILLVISASSIAQVYVDANATGANNGTSWANAYTDLQTAISNIGANTTIHVAQGTYYPTTSTDRGISFNIPNNRILLGGYPSGGGERNYELYPTVLSGDIGVKNDHTDNSYHLLFFNETSPTTEVDGFIIEHGYADGSGSNADGGGIYVYTASAGSRGAIIRNCIIRNNYAKGNGGGIRINKRADIYNCQIYSNTAEMGGGLAINIDGRIYNSKVVNNIASFGGGGIYISGFNSAPKAINTIVSNNVAPSGSGIYMSNGLTINCTITNNEGDNTVYLGTYGSVQNTVIWGNNNLVSNRINEAGRFAHCAFDEATTGIDYTHLSNDNEGAESGVSYPCFRTITNLKGNAQTEEELNEILSSQWTLNPCSKLIDEGNNDMYPSSSGTTPLTDCFGNERTINSIIDIGANEAKSKIMVSDAASISSSSCNLSAEISFAESGSSVERGFVYDTVAEFDIPSASEITHPTSGTGVYTCELNALDAETDYHFRAWVNVDGVKYYSTEMKFTTASSLVAYYPFNGNANDESGNENHGSVNGATLVADRNGNPDQAYSFDGNDGIDVPHNDVLNMSGPLSIAFWVKPTTLSGTTMVIGKSNYTSTTNYLVRLKNTGAIQWEYQNYTENSSPLITTGTWQHITVTSSGPGAGKKIYINGRLAATSNPSGGTYGLVNNGLTIGYAGYNAEHYNGAIDEVRIYNTELSSDDVSDLYNQVPTNTNQAASVKDIEVYPNPVINVLHIRLADEINHVSIYNSNGQIVYNNKTCGIKEEIAMDGMASGVYILHVSSKNKTQTLKIIKQ